jgi:geranylgeranyl pyrophosphate synthase
MRLRKAEHALELGKIEQEVLQPLEQWRDTMLPFTAPVPGAETAFPSTAPATSEAERSVDGGAASSRLDDDGPTSFVERLDWYRKPVLDVLQWVVPESEPRKYLYGPLRDFVNRPAKGLRPGLCLATCRSYGGTVSDALPSATALELLHHAFLVHDDIEDESVSRRGAKALHRQVGDAAAINIGDALNAYAMRTLRMNVDRLGPEKALAIFDEVDHLLIESLEGQAIELGWVRDNQSGVDVEDYLRMVLKKTAWYSFIHPMRIGALAAGADDDLDRFNRFGFLLGAAFQIQDDVLNLTGMESRYGKEIGGDLWEGKRTVVLARAFDRASPKQRDQLARFLAGTRQDRLPRQVYAIYDLLVETGAIEWARSLADALTGAARDHLADAFRGAEEGPDLEFIHTLVGYLVERER